MPWSIPAIAFLIVAALRGGGATLAEAARYEAIRRAITPAATRSLTMADLPAVRLRAEVLEPEAKPAETPAKTSDPQAKEPDAAAKVPELSESEWREKMAAARLALESDQVLADAMQGRVNGLISDVIGRDDPAQRAELSKQRDRAQAELDRLLKQIDKDKLAIATIEDDARKKGIPPGWIR